MNMPDGTTQNLNESMTMILSDISLETALQKDFPLSS